MSKKDSSLNVSRCRYCDAKVGKGATICSGCHQKLKAVRTLRATLNLIAKPKGRNYDRIKAMSVDEMSNFLMDWALKMVEGTMPMNVKAWLESEIEK